LQQVDDCDALEIYQGIQLARLVESKGIDHLHAHFATSATAVTRIASLLTGVTYSLTAHAKDIFHEDVDEKQLERKLADASAVVTVSNYNAADLTRRFPRQSQQIHRIYNGLPLSQYNYRAPDDRAKKIVAVGRLVEKKGFSDLISACAILRQIGLAIPCEIIGEGEFEDSLRSQIQQLELEDSVRLLGALPQREVHRIIQEASIFVAPCVTASTGDRDGLPTVILEAMALGTPCISTDVTGISEVVRHNETGLIVPERQPVKLAEEIHGLLSDVELGVKLAHSAWQLIQEQFDALENTSRLRDVFASYSVPRSKKSGSQPILAEVG
jgi:glycosyltransferase involved in cell wall biosynthesis